MLAVLGLPPSSTAEDAVTAIEGLRASALALLETGEQLQATIGTDDDAVAWALVEPLLTAGRGLVDAVAKGRPAAIDAAREALDAALRELE